MRIADALHEKKKFVQFVECDRETALLHEYNGYSSCCGDNNYFYLNRVAECSLSSEKFSKSEMELIQDNLFCCYTYGQPCNHENEMCECQMAAATGDHKIVLGIDETTIEDEQNIGLIPPMFQIYTKTLINLQTQEYVVLDGEIPENIYCISNLAQEIENYPSSASEKLLINNFWSCGMRNDLDLKSFDDLAKVLHLYSKTGFTCKFFSLYQLLNPQSLENLHFLNHSFLLLEESRL